MRARPSLRLHRRHPGRGHPPSTGARRAVSTYPESGKTGYGDPPGLRRWLYRQLDPAEHAAFGLSPLNCMLVVAIIVSTLVAVVETEPNILHSYDQFFLLAELCFGIAFLVEYLARLWVAVESPRFAGKRHPRLRYALTPAALIDLVAVLPMIMELAGGSSVVLRFFRVLRILRLAKLGRMSRAWRHIYAALYNRRFELSLTLAFAFIAMLVSATMLYWAEGHVQPDKFGSIPRALWWSIVTITTVGYGDVYPVTPLGKFFSGLSAISAIAIIAMPAGIMASAFSEAIRHHRAHDGWADDKRR